MCIDWWLMQMERLQGLRHESCTGVRALSFRQCEVTAEFYAGYNLIGLPQWLSSKESTCSAGHAGSVPWWRRYPGRGHGNPLQYSCLENPMDRGSWQAMARRVTKTQIQLKGFTWKMYWRKQITLYVSSITWSCPTMLDYTRGMKNKPKKKAIILEAFKSQI